MINELMRRRALLMAKQLPYDAEIEYLEGAQGAYIKTGFIINSSNWRNLRLEFDGSLAGGAVSQWRVMGIGYTNPSYYIGMDNAHRVVYGKGNVTDTRVNRTLSTTEYTSRHLYTYDYKNAVLKFDNTAYNMTLDSSSNINEEFYLYTWNGGNYTATFLDGGKLYGFRIYNNDVLVMDMQPVRVGQVGYLYDKISKQLFGNDGTGSFILGNDINT